MIQVLEHLLSLCKTPSTTKKKEGQKSDKQWPQFPFSLCTNTFFLSYAKLPLESSWELFFKGHRYVCGEETKLGPV
jgi:hypothetical protein